jgi:hypothetical protein
MRFKIVTLFFFIVFANVAVGQEPFWLKKGNMKEVVAFEKSLKPRVNFLKMNVSLSESVFPFLKKYKIGNPIIAQRKENFGLPLYTSYFFSEDSILRFTSYDWEIDMYGNFFDKQKIWKAEREKLKFYNSEYERIRALLTLQLGKPSLTDDGPNLVEEDGSKYLTRDSKWENEDYKAELTLVFEASTFRIRLNHYWKN